MMNSRRRILAEMNSLSLQIAKAEARVEVINQASFLLPELGVASKENAQDRVIELRSRYARIVDSFNAIYN